VICFTVYGYGGWVEAFLPRIGHATFMPLARMSFAVYLIHLIRIQMYFSDLNEGHGFYFDDVLSQFIAILVFSFFWAFWLCLLVEFPMAGATKVLVG